MFSPSELSQPKLLVRSVVSAALLSLVYKQKHNISQSQYGKKLNIFNISNLTESSSQTVQTHSYVVHEGNNI